MRNSPNASVIAILSIPPPNNLLQTQSTEKKILKYCSSTALRPIYTKRQRQCCDNSAMMLAIPFSLKTMESLQNGVATYFQATPLTSMRTKLQASSQSCRGIDADAWCKRALRVNFDRPDPETDLHSIQVTSMSLKL